jgi:subtilisin family serine protease
MSFEILHKQWKKIIFAAIVLLCLILLFEFACRSRTAPPNTTSIPQTTTPEEQETFHGVAVAPKQILIKINPVGGGMGARCDGVDSKKLTEMVRKFAQETISDNSATVSRVANGCWFRIKSPTLSVQRLMDSLKLAIDNKRPLNSDQLSAVVVHAEPNFLFKVNLPGDDEPLRADQPQKAFVVSAHASGTPNDTLFQQNKLWGLKNDDHPGIDVHANEAWNLSTGSRDIVVGVIDSGIYYSHPDLLDNMWSAPEEFDVTVGDEVIHCPQGSHGYNAVAGTVAEICDPVDGTTNFGHGTHVSGIIGAVGNNAKGVVGVNWSTKLLGLKVFGGSNTATVSDVVNAIEFAIQLHQRFGTQANIRVLNASLGFLAVGADADVDPTLLREEIELAGNLAANNDMLFVASAGEDDGNDNDAVPHYPSGFYDLPNLLSVTAIDETGALAVIHGTAVNHGATSVHLAAPGKAIYSTYPVNLGFSYYKKAGTSMSTPFVSGAAALMLSVPNCATKHAADLKQLIMQGTNPMASPSPAPPTTATGGRLNVFKSIQLCGP